MLDILLSRLAQLVVVLVGVSFLTFFMLNLLPGDPAVATLGDDATPEALASFRAEHDLDRPVLTRYLTWAGGAVTGDLGQSYRNDRDVLDTIVDRVPVSLELVVIAQVISLALAIPAALLAVWKRNTIVDRALSMSAFAGLSIPSFLLAFLLILVFAVQLNWLPASGFTRISEGFGDNLRTALLPALTLSLSQYSVYMRLLRSEMIETLGNEYITTAYGKGLGVRRILVRHVMRNSLFSMITVIGVNIGVLLGGAVITESIFAIPGIGRLLIDSISQRDLMMVQGVVLFVAVTYVVINLLVDLSYTLLDPRIRHGSRAE
ncbi:MAG: ABC transporter permease [Actinobacteria bacterium]|nr:ABC transporter permease [Actinomycetota bacterium]